MITQSPPNDDGFNNRASTPESFFIVAIGASAGGLQPLESFFATLPPETKAAFVVVQHLSPSFRSLTPDILQRHTEFPIQVMAAGTQLQPRQVYVLPAGFTATLEGLRLRLAKRPESGSNYPIDQFFLSLAREGNEHTIGILLSGTGNDGTQGLRAIHHAGGIAMVQSPSTTQFESMVENAIATGIIDRILSPEDLAYAVHDIVNLSANRENLPDHLAEDIPPRQLNRILVLLQDQERLDFSQYKPGTLNRRIQHRLILSKSENLEAYIHLLSQTPAEVKRLGQDLLIGSTRFFRDPHLWDYLHQEGIPQILATLQSGQVLRMWVPACATGEEVYTLAMVVNDVMRDRNQVFPLKIFATDIDAEALAIASRGIYGETLVQGSVSEERQQRYFNKDNQTFIVKPSLRDQIVFAPHDLSRNAGFSQMHLISCRNVLIYMQPSLQQQVLRLLHFSLQPRGLLVLGSSEGLGPLETAFINLGDGLKVFQKSADVSLGAVGLPRQSVARPLQPSRSSRPQAGQYDRFLGAILRLYFHDRAMTCVLINSRHQILHVFMNTAQLLSFPQQEANLTLTEMVPLPLRLPLSTALHRIRRKRQPVIFTDIAMADTLAHGSKATLRVNTASEAGTFGDALIVLIELMLPENAEPTVPSPATPLQPFDLDAEAAQHIADLEAELQQTREHLQTTIAELETTNEEYQATNEELLASNEELQSANEELQSLNEELHTLNAENQSRIHQLTDLNADINNLLKSTDIGVVFLDSQLNVRRFTPAAAQLFSLRPNDTGRPLTELTHFLDITDLVQRLLQVIETGAPVEQEVADVNAQMTYLMRLLPYRREDDTQDGVVLTLININDQKQVQNSLAEQRAFVQKIAESTPDIISIFELPLGRVTYVNHALQRVLGYSPDLIYSQGDKGLMSLVHPHDRPALQEHFATLNQASNGDILQFEVRFRHQNGQWRWFNQRNTVFQRKPDGRPDQILGISTDVTEARQMQHALQRSETLFRKTLEGSQVIVFTHDLDLRYTWIYNPAGTFTPEEVLGRTDAELLPDPEGAARLMAIKRRALETEQAQQGEVSVLLPDDAPPHCYDGTYSPLYDAEGNLSGVMAVVVDITERKQIETELQQARQQLEEAQRVARVGSWRHDLSTDHIEWSTELFHMFGLDPTSEGLSFETWLNLIHPEDRALFLEAYEATRTTGNHLDIDVRFVPNNDNGQIHINVIGKAEGTVEDPPKELLGTILDITDRKRTEAALHHQAFYDQLTQLPNRNLFLEQLKLFLRRAQRDQADPFAVLYLDIDDFKEINDTLGHLTGDVFLLEVAQRLQSCLRPGDVVARLGGDEFAMLLEAADRNTAHAVAERIQAAFTQPFAPRGQSFDAAASIGIALFTPEVIEAEDTALLENADIAMYRAKGQGPGQIEVFEPRMRSQDIARVELKANLKSALGQQQFELYYQPIVDLNRLRLRGFEALLRWRHPNGDLLSPGAFMDVLHGAHFMFDVEAWVVEHACRQLQGWMQQFPRIGPSLRLSINLSPESLAKPDLLRHCRQVLQKTTILRPQQLSVEITEDFLIDTSGLILPNLNHLRDLGIGIALDDFGTGYSSLSCLHQLPITTVKIDRAFVSALATDENLMRITTGISALAQVLNLELIAEGIETEQQLNFLLNSGYSLGQGYWFAEPLSVAAATRLLEQPTFRQKS